MARAIGLYLVRWGAIGAALIFVALVASPSARAAPFCVETQAVPPQCIYFDARDCAVRARQLGGTCSVNTSEVKVSAGLGHYCMMTTGLVSSCIFLSLNECDREARHQGGVCVFKPSRAESPALDPYREIRPGMAGG